MKFFVYRFVIRNAVFSSKRVLTVSEHARRDLLKHYAVPSEKILVTHEAALPFCFVESEKNAIVLFRRLGLLRIDTDDSALPLRDIIAPYALYVGNAYPHKNLESLLHVFSRFPRKEARLVLVGREDYFYRRLKAIVRRKKLRTVVFAGFVPDAHLDTLYRFARLSVFPSLYEGFGLPPLEAMAKGTPVLAASAASVPEILGNAALLYDPFRENALSSALLRLWDDEALQETYRQRGYWRAALFSWDDLGRKTLDAYRAIASQRIRARVSTEKELSWYRHRKKTEDAG